MAKIILTIRGFGYKRTKIYGLEWEVHQRRFNQQLGFSYKESWKGILKSCATFFADSSLLSVICRLRTGKPYIAQQHYRYTVGEILERFKSEI